MANLLWLGLSEQKVKETEKNAALLKQLVTIIGVAEQTLKKAGKSKDELTKQQVCTSALLSLLPSIFPSILTHF